MRGSLARVGTEETRRESYLRMLGTDPVFRLDEGSTLIYYSIKFSLLARTYSIFVSGSPFSLSEAGSCCEIQFSI